MRTQGVLREILESIGLVSSFHLRDIFGACINSLQTCDRDQDYDKHASYFSLVYF